MKNKILTFVVTLIMSLGICSTSFAAASEGLIGFVNMETVLNSYPNIKAVAQEITGKQAELQQSFDEQASVLNAQEKAELRDRLNQELGKFENSKMAPVQKNINKAILKVAKEQNIKSVVNMTAMLAGGQDLTKLVVEELQK